MSGAGAESTNVILTKTNAHLDNSIVTATAGSQNVSLSATNTSTINANVGAASVALGIGGTGGVGASIGAALSRNLIGWDLSGNELPARVQAYVSSGSSINASGSLTQTATSGQTVNAIVAGGFRSRRRRRHAGRSARAVRA